MPTTAHPTVPIFQRTEYIIPLSEWNSAKIVYLSEYFFHVVQRYDDVFIIHMVP